MTVVRVLCWRYTFRDDDPSRAFPTRHAARHALMERHSLDARYADRFVWPEILPVPHHDEGANP